MVAVLAAVPTAVMATKLVSLMAAEVTVVAAGVSVTAPKVTAVMASSMAAKVTVMTAKVTSVMANKVATMMTAVMLHLDYLVLSVDRGRRQRRCDTRGEAANQYDGCGNRGQHL